MINLWNESEAASCKDDLDHRVYSSRLLGRESSLVLHGGGNTSVKIKEKNILGEEETLLYVKGSGWDLVSIDREGFAPVRLDHLLHLAELESLSDPQMVNELKTHMTIASAPTPSVEAILHAILPYKFVDHTHADSAIAVTNTPHGEKYVREIYGDEVVIIPYIMPGFDLARDCARIFHRDKTDRTIGMVLLNHGVFSFAETARESYERMIDLVTRAEDFLKAKGAWEISYADAKHIAPTEDSTDARNRMQNLSHLRHDLSVTMKMPILLRSQRDTDTLSFLRRKDLERICTQGPATPDHVIRTKRLPLIGRDIESYVDRYCKYFELHAPKAREPKTMLDPAPRVLLDPELGLLSSGKTITEAKIVEDIYLHTIDVILRAEALDTYQALPAKDIFDMEYWDLEQAKLRKGGTTKMFRGEIVLITGGASGIGRACVDSFLKRGAAVIVLDTNPAVESLLDRPDYLGIVCDVTDKKQIQSALVQAVESFGGLDMLVLNAGMFPTSVPVAELEDELWNKVLSVNLSSALILLRNVHPLLKQAPQGGRIVFMGSKNVAAPGPGAAAYSASKAALNQLMRIVAMEWATDAIRVNALHPDAVFDTGIWSDDIIASRAERYGLKPEEYRKRNLMKTEIKSSDVAELTAELCGPLFAKTMAAGIPVDGGDMRVI